MTEFSIVGEGGDLHTFELAPGTSVRLAERDLTEEVGRYLNLVGSSRAADIRSMTLTASGSGDREIFVSYISEVPVWKSTYRILMPGKPGEKALLQGWAVVDNTIGEDWDNVELSLVAGAPQSFVQNISQPYYVRRPEIALPESAQLTPQTHEATIEQFDKLQQFSKLQSAGKGGTGVLTGLQGFVRDATGAAVPNAKITVRNEETGASQQHHHQRAGPLPLRQHSGWQLRALRRRSGFQALSVDQLLSRHRSHERDRRTPRSRQHVDNRRSHCGSDPSANHVRRHYLLAPKARSPKPKPKVSATTSNTSSNKRSLSAKTNPPSFPSCNPKSRPRKSHSGPPAKTTFCALSGSTTPAASHLDSGTFNLLDADAFAGEGVLETIHPGERRLISYAADPAVHVKYSDESSERPFTHIRIAKGIMLLTQEQRKSNKFTIRNADTEPRQVIVEYPAEEGWTLTPATPKPEESSESFHRFRVPVDPGKTAELTVESVHPEETRYELTNLDDDEVALLVDQKRMTPAMQQAFDRILKQKEKVDEISGQITERKRESDQIAADQNRIRENMKALKGSSEEKALLQRYVGQLDAQESRLAALRKESSDLTVQENQASAELDRMIMEVNVDETF